MKVKVAKWGNSLGVRLPKAAADAVGASDGCDLELFVEGGALRLVPRVKTSRDLMNEMIDEIDRLGLKSPDTLEWGPGVGSEIIDDDYSRGLIVPGPDGAPVYAKAPPLIGDNSKRNVRSRRR